MKVLNYEIPERKELIQKLYAKLQNNFIEIRKNTF